MSRCAIYARYSTDEQRETSIEDQVRRCHAVAERHGLTVPPSFVFADEAISGTAKGNSKRSGYRRLLDALDAGEFEVVVVDELSRLTRSPSEGGRLMELVEARGLRFISADGVDTGNDGWKLLWMMKLATATHEVDATAHRTRRGMLGQLERGYQIAQAPFGYRPVKEVTPGGRALGTRWVVDEDEAAVVRQLYDWRRNGLSAAQIAQRLNESGVLPPGSYRAKGHPYWRPASVLRVLSNTVYRGVFVWNGSTFTKHKAKRKRKAVEEVPFPRPELRIVPDDVWFEANPSESQRYQRVNRPRGGGRSLLAGLVHCGECHALCSPGYGKNGGTLYCPQCEVAHRARGRSTWLGYSSCSAAKQALRWVLHQVFSQDAVRAALHERLEARLRKGPDEDIEALKREVQLIVARLKRIKQLMLQGDSNAQAFQPELNAALRAHTEASMRLERLQKAALRVDEQSVQAQMRVDVSTLIDSLLDDEAPTVEPYKAKATLRRMLTRFEFIERPRKGCSVFIVGLCPGVLLADATQTAVLDNQETLFEVTSEIQSRCPVVWGVRGRMLAGGEPSTEEPELVAA